MLLMTSTISFAGMTAEEGQNLLKQIINESIKKQKDQNPESEQLKAVEETKRKEQELIDQHNQKLELQRQQEELAKQKQELEFQARQQAEFQRQQEELAKQKQELEFQAKQQVDYQHQQHEISQQEEIEQLQQEETPQRVELQQEEQQFNSTTVLDNSHVNQNQFNETISDANDTSEGYFSGLGKKIEDIIGFTILVLTITIPLALFVLEDAKYKKSDGCRKVRDITDGFITSLVLLILPLIIFAFAMENEELTTSEFSIRILGALILFIAGLRMFLQESVGYILDKKNMKIMMPGSSRDADSFLDYLNPKFLTRYFFRETINVDDLIDVSQRVEEKYTNDGKLKLRYILNLTTKNGNYIMKFRSRAKCDSLAHLFIEAYELPRYSMTPRD
jgi:hypothetical protein